MNQQELITTLEPLVDKTSLFDVAMALSLVCTEKSEHVLINWQDKPLSKRWQRAEKVLTDAVRKLPNEL